MGRATDGIDFLVDVVRTAYELEIRYPAAALAYYAFVSFVPFLLLVFAVAGERLVDGVSRTAPEFLTPEAQQLVERSLLTASGRTGAGLLSVLVLLWSSANVVGDVCAVVRRIEGTDGRTSPYRVRETVAVLGGLGLAMLSIATTSALFEFLFFGPVFGLAGFGVLWILLTGAFVPVYYVPSDLLQSPSDTLPGAALAAFGWTVIHTFVLFYAATAGQYAIYGVLSGVIIVLTTLYLAAVLLLAGVVVNTLTVTGADDREIPPL